MNKDKATSKRTTLKRAPHRGSHTRADAYEIIDNAWVCNVGFVAKNPDNNQPVPYVLPMNCWRVGNQLLVHVAYKSRFAKELAKGGQCCVTITLPDALVYGRTGFTHSFNYRSVMVFGAPRMLDDKAEKSAALDALVNKMDIQSKRSDSLPPITEGELKATAVFSFEIAEFSVKTRDVGVNDKADDIAQSNVWAGVIPLALACGKPVPDTEISHCTPPPVPAGVRCNL